MVWINKDLWKINEKSCCCQLSHSPASKEEANGGTAGEQTLCSCFSHCSLLHSFACESYKSFELIWAVIQRITVLLTKVCISTIPGYEQDSLLLVQACWPDAPSFSRHNRRFKCIYLTYKVIIKQHDELRNEALDKADTATWWQAEHHDCVDSLWLTPRWSVSVGFGAVAIRPSLHQSTLVHYFCSLA